MAVFTLAGELQQISMAPIEVEEKEAMDFFGEGWEDERFLSTLTEDSEVGVVLEDTELVVGVEEDTLAEAVETPFMSPVEEGEVLIMLVKINKMIVVIKLLVMVR